MEISELTKVEWRVSQQCGNVKQALLQLIDVLDELKKNSDCSVASNKEILDKYGIYEVIQKIL